MSESIEDADEFEFIIRTSALFTERGMITGSRGQKGVEVLAEAARDDGHPLEHVVTLATFDSMLQLLEGMIEHHRQKPTHIILEIDSRVEPFVDVDEMEQIFTIADPGAEPVSHRFVFHEFDEQAEMTKIEIE